MASLSKVSWLLVFILFALPLLFFPWAYLAFELPKVFLLYLFSATAAYLLLRSGYRLGRLTKIHILFLALLAWIIFTAIFGLSFQQSFLGSYFRWQGILSWACYSLLFFISGKVFTDIHFRKHASFAILVSSTFAASLALIQFLSLWFLGNTNQLLYSNRIISTFGQPNFLGAYLVLSLPFVWYFLKQIKGIGKILTGLLMVVIILGIFSTLSRSAYIGLAFLAIIWGVYHYRLLLTGIVFSVLLFGLFANLFPNLVFREWYRFQVDMASRWTAENRLIITQRSVELIGQKPVTGYGLENFSLAFPSVVNQSDLGLKDIAVDSSHNLFLDLGAQIGLVGLALFLIIIVLSSVLGLKRARQASTNEKDFIKTAISVCLAFIIIHQFSPNSIVPMVLFWISLGIINEPALEYNGINRTSKRWVNFIGIPLILVTIGLVIQTIRADILFRNASAYEVSDINRAIKLDNEAIKLAPWIEFYRIRRDFLIKQLG